MRWILVAASALVLMGCAVAEQIDMKNLSILEPYPDGKFKYKSFASVGYREGDDRAETVRLNELQRRLDINNLCSNGYEITRRTAVLNYQAVSAGVYDIFYYGRCK